MKTSKPRIDDPAQSQRFIEMAREIGADERPDAFEHAFKAITRPANVVSHSSPPKRVPRSQDAS